MHRALVIELYLFRYFKSIRDMLVYDLNNHASELLITVTRLDLFDIPLSFFFFGLRVTS